MRNKKAIYTLFFAGFLIIVSVILKDNIPDLIHYTICLFGVALAIASTMIEKKSKGQ